MSNLLVYSAVNYEFVKQLEHITYQIQSICFDSTGELLVSIYHGEIKVWRQFELVETVQLEQKFNKVEFSPDGQFIMVFSNYNPSCFTVLNQKDL